LSKKKKAAKAQARKPVGPRSVPGGKTRARWAAEISAIHERVAKQTIKGIFEIGRKLIAAKRALAHGEFVRMIERELPFGASVAQRLMKIARDRRLRKAAHGPLLPPAWRMLYELTKLSDQEFADAVASGKVNPKMKRADIAPAIRYTTLEVLNVAKTVTSVMYIKPPSVDAPSPRRQYQTKMVVVPHVPPPSNDDDDDVTSADADAQIIP